MRFNCSVSLVSNRECGRGRSHPQAIAAHCYRFPRTHFRSQIAIATIAGKLQSGTLLQESARVIPKDLKLRIGLDPSLGLQVPKLPSDRIEIL